MRIVFGMVDDLDFKTVIRMLPANAVYYFTKAKTKRAINEQILMNTGKELGLNVRCFPDVRSAYIQAISDSDNEDFVFVGGSSYIVADFVTDCL